jgi:hypothetical protein
MPHVDAVLPSLCTCHRSHSPFKFNNMRRDGDHRLTKGDVLGAVGPLMHTAQAGIVFMGSTQSDPRNVASIWEDFRDSMRELATDQVAAAIATGAFDEVDVAHTGKIQGVPPSSCCTNALFRRRSLFHWTVLLNRIWYKVQQH